MRVDRDTGGCADFKESIECEGFQNPVILFQGKILDGRGRGKACAELGLMVPAVEFVGTEQEALQYVIASNQRRRNLTPSLRAAVAADLLPEISEDVNQKRIAKLRQTLASKAEGECLPNLANTPGPWQDVPRARVLVADLMGGSHGYVGQAKQIKDASPELFEKVRAAEITLSAALNELNGTPDDPHVIRIKSVRQKLNKLLKNADLAPALLDRIEAVLAEFA